MRPIYVLSADEPAVQAPANGSSMGSLLWTAAAVYGTYTLVKKTGGLLALAAVAGAGYGVWKLTSK